MKTAGRRNEYIFATDRLGKCSVYRGDIRERGGGGVLVPTLVSYKKGGGREGKKILVDKTSKFARFYFLPTLR